MNVVSAIAPLAGGEYQACALAAAVWVARMPGAPPVNGSENCRSPHPILSVHAAPPTRDTLSSG
eukprot:scaffold211894_cov34-Tisochrysis_lutea.AAC.2